MLIKASRPSQELSTGSTGRLTVPLSLYPRTQWLTDLRARLTFSQIWWRQLPDAHCTTSSGTSKPLWVARYNALNPPSREFRSFPRNLHGVAFFLYIYPTSLLKNQADFNSRQNYTKRGKHSLLSDDLLKEKQKRDVWKMNFPLNIIFLCHTWYSTAFGLISNKSLSLSSS